MAAWQPPRKPGDRFASVDSVPEDALNDVDFQRAVQQLEEQQSNRAGWLFPTGAFDKGDQMFVRERQEKMQHLEEAQVERERSEFEAARLAADEREARLRAASAAETAAARAAAAKRQQEAERKRRLPVVRIKSAGTGAGARCEPDLKKQRSASQQPGAAPPLRGAPRAHEAAGEARGADDAAAGLGGLLGGYGSDTDGTDGEPAPVAALPGDAARPEAPGATQPRAPGVAAPAAAPALPSASDLLNS